MASVQQNRLTGLKSAVAIKAPCKVATTANIVLSGLQTIDGVAVLAGDRVLVKNQTTTTQNGIYDASATTWTRSPDFANDNDLVNGGKVYITGGTLGLGDWLLTSANPIALGSSVISFAAYTSPSLTTAVASATASASAASSSAAAAAASAASVTAVDVQIHAATGKTPPVDADEFGIWDSVSLGLRKLTWANLKATIKTYIDSFVATSAQYLANTAGKYLTTDGVWGALATPTVLTPGATVAWDLAQGIDFTLAAAQNFTLSNPTNVKVGQRGCIRILQDVTGSRTFTKSSNMKVAGGVTIVLSTAAGAIDYLDYHAFSATEIRLSVSKGWA